MFVSLDRQAELARLAPCPYRVSAYCLFTHSRGGCGDWLFSKPHPPLRGPPSPKGKVTRYCISLVHTQQEHFTAIPNVSAYATYQQKTTKTGGVALSDHPHKNVSERRYFCKLLSNLNAMFDVFGFLSPKCRPFGRQIKIAWAVAPPCDSPCIRQIP